MFLIKLMSSQDLPDTDMAKNYSMVAIGAGDQFDFRHDERGLPIVVVTPKEGESFTRELYGNAYVISSSGKTVATHWARSLFGRDETIYHNVVRASVTYYSQVIADGYEPQPYDLLCSPEWQRYEEHKNLNIAIMNTDFNTTHPGGPIKHIGSGYINETIVPNIHDVFLVKGEGDIVFVHRITKAIREARGTIVSYYVEWEIVGRLQTMQLYDLELKTNDTYTHSSTREKEEHCNGVGLGVDTGMFKIGTMYKDTVINEVRKESFTHSTEEEDYSRTGKQLGSLQNSRSVTSRVTGEQLHGSFKSCPTDGR